MRRFDVHHHIVPDFLREELERSGGDPAGWHIPSWSEESAVALMESHSIGRAYASVTFPGASCFKGQRGRDISRRINEYGSSLSKRLPRFRYFASLPSLLDVEGCINEILFCKDSLNVAGFIIFTSYGGKYLGDATFTDVWETLSRTGLVVFIHPCPLDGQAQLPDIPFPLIDFPHETARTATSLVLSGQRRKYPALPIILSHGGGTLSCLAHRISFCTLLPGNSCMKMTRESVIHDFKLFYVDTAGVFSESMIKSMLEFFGKEKILFGSDIPYTLGLDEIVTDFDNFFKRNAVEFYDDILFGNALKLFKE